MSGGHLTALGIDCARCEQTPGLRERLGCGRPPQHDPGARDRTGARLLDDGRVVTPGEAAAEGLPAYTVGLGTIRASWPWCPRWWDAYDDTLLDGRPTADAMAEAHWLVEHGSAASVWPGPWTPAMVEGLRLHRACKAEDERLRLERQARAAERKAKRRG